MEQNSTGAKDGSLDGRQDARRSGGQERKIAFTLAETLITLVIVGIVAALTIPNLIVKYQKEQTVTKLKKAYSTLNQAAEKSVMANGNMNTWDFPKTISDTNFSLKYVVPYLSIAKSCYAGAAVTIMKCANSNATAPYQPNGSKVTSSAYSYDYGGMFFLNDGTRISPMNDLVHGMYQINVDIDGSKGKNRMGRDSFYFTYDINANRIIPFCGTNTTRKNLLGSCNKNNGRCCAALIIKDGWQIKDDYPW